MDPCSMPGFPVHHQLLELAQTHVHRGSNAIQPTHPLSCPSPPALQSFPASGSFPMSQFFTSGGHVNKYKYLYLEQNPISLPFPAYSFTLLLISFLTELRPFDRTGPSSHTPSSHLLRDLPLLFPGMLSRSQHSQLLLAIQVSAFSCHMIFSGFVIQFLRLEHKLHRIETSLTSRSREHLLHTKWWIYEYIMSKWSTSFWHGS